MHSERRKGLAYSVAFHVLLLLVLIFGLPSILKNEPPVEPIAISVDILPISEKSNVKNSEAEKAEKESEKEATQKKPAPPVKTSEPPPPPPEPTPAPTPPNPEEKKPEPVKPAPKPEPKPEPPKPEPPKPEPKKVPKKPKVDPLAAILKSVQETAQEESKDQKKELEKKTATTPKAKSTIYNPNAAMSQSEMDAISGQLMPCWNPPAGAKDAQNLLIKVEAEFDINGKYINAELSSESQSRANSDPFFRAAADAALRAIRNPRCSPLKNLPPEKYETWKSMEIIFDPKNLL